HGGARRDGRRAARRAGFLDQRGAPPLAPSGEARRVLTPRSLRAEIPSRVERLARRGALAVLGARRAARAAPAAAPSPPPRGGLPASAARSAEKARYRVTDLLTDEVSDHGDQTLLARHTATSLGRGLLLLQALRRG